MSRGGKARSPMFLKGYLDVQHVCNVTMALCLRKDIRNMGRCSRHQENSHPPLPSPPAPHAPGYEAPRNHYLPHTQASELVNINFSHIDKDSEKRRG